MTQDAPVALKIALRFKAPPERVFDAWLDPTTVGRWLFATKDGEMQRVKVDPRVGGEFVITEKRGDQLAEHFGRYVEIDRPKRLVFGFATDRESAPARVTVDIAPAAGGCQLALTHELDPQWAAFEERARSGWTMILESLADTLAEPSARADEAFRMTRVFDAPRELVWKAFTEADRLAQWWGPKGFTMTSCKIDLRPGGLFHYGMRSADGHEMWGKWVFREIVARERLVFVLSFSDAKRGTTRHPLSQTWPLEMLSTINFSDLGDKTLIESALVPVNASDEERKTFDAGHDSMKQGFTGTWDQLDAHLAKVR